MRSSLTEFLHITPNCAFRRKIPIQKPHRKRTSHSSYALCLDVIFDNKYPLLDCKFRAIAREQI